MATKSAPNKPTRKKAARGATKPRAGAVKTRKISLALQGGGAHGAVTWGVLDRLLEDDRIDTNAISGTSAGALNAVAVAYGLHLDGCAGARAKLDELWSAISRSGQLFSPIKRTPLDMIMGGYNLDSSLSYQFFDTLTRTFSPYQLNPFDFNPLQDVMADVIDFDRLRTCTNVNLYLSATNVRTGKVQVFETKDVSLEVVAASTCLPFIFKAVEIDGEHYWDGGYMGNPVLFPFFYTEDSNDIVVVHVNPLTRDDVPTTAPDIMNRINEISFNSSLLREFRAINFVHKLLKEGWIKDEYVDRLSDVRVHSIRSDQSLNDLSVASKFNTEWEFLNQLKDRGRQIADQWLAENFDAVGTRSSVDLREIFDSTH
ncbi:MAG: patatin-like phospholipase family protein [Pseudomonadota bacterium]